MSTEPRLISVVGEKPRPKYYVYYDEWSGEIINVTNKYKVSNNPHLLTEDGSAAEILLGHANPKKFMINETPDGIFLMKKSQALRIKAAEDQLSKIQEIPLTFDREINIITYVNSWKIEINISGDAVYRMTGKRNNRKFSAKENTNNSMLVFYIIAKDNPLHLVKTIEIDPIELVNDGYKLYDVSDLQNVIGLNDISILTRRVFKSYGLKSKASYATIDYLKRKNSRRNHYEIEKNSSTDDTVPFSISKSTAGWVFKSNFNDPAELRIYGDVIFYITGDTPFDLKDKVHIPISEIGNHKEFYIKTDADLLSSKILIGEEGKHLSFKYEEIKYVESGKY